jgi:hypothetical protein
MLYAVPAVDAVDTLRVLSRWFVLLGEVRLCVYPSAGTISIRLPSDYIYPYRCVGGSRSQHCAPRHGVAHDVGPADVRLHTWEVLFSEVELQQLLVSSGEYARIR